MAGNKPERLRLLARDGDDLAVLSAHMQDALVRLGDMAFLPAERRFVLVGSRFDWLRAGERRMERGLTGMHFDNVLKAGTRGFDPKNPDILLNLLGILFEPSLPPSGFVTLAFSGGASVRLEIECLEVRLLDLGARWKTKRRPGHADEGAADGPQTGAGR